MKSDKTILFLGKEQDLHCTRALDFCLKHFQNVTAFAGKWGDRLPAAAKEWTGDYIISYLSRWVVPASLLQRAREAAFNFHPGSPDYPGIGCINFALYEDAAQYGVTCHHMETQVDTGGIIAVKRFPIFQADTVHSLLTRTHDFQLALFYEVMGGIVAGKPLAVSEEKWTRTAFTRKEFDKLGRITIEMDPAEIARRVRATSFGIYQPVVEVGGFTFELKPDTLA
jgi:methionyl-tRNA formyltransferase